MTPKPTQKKQPFVIEPLAWIAPEVERNEPSESAEDAKQAPAGKEQRS